MLGYYKYANFILQSIHTWSPWQDTAFAPLRIELPVGISFFTFQALAYTIDVSRGTTNAEKHLGKFAAFIAFFPQLVAGPIERSSRLLPQMGLGNSPQYANFVLGFRWMLSGALKKIVVADNVSSIVNAILANPSDQGAGILALGMTLFGVQIYCDFAGYSEIARGAARVVGIDLMENFRRPYFATSLGEFWRRWHISLSHLVPRLRLLPVGRQSSGTAGDTTKQPCWCSSSAASGTGRVGTSSFGGLIHGVVLCAEVLARPITGHAPNWLRHTWGRVYVLLVVITAWAFFRLSFEDAAQALSIVCRGEDWSLRGITLFRSNAFPAPASLLGLRSD